ncbi:hypothetical protein, partial [Xanthomonas citri]|uniref:hypothetical protein n=1 Tax=Xanthomonas citri TaxID=346 RepID=UPI0019808B72
MSTEPWAYQLPGKSAEKLINEMVLVVHCQTSTQPECSGARGFPWHRSSVSADVKLTHSAEVKV